MKANVKPLKTIAWALALFLVFEFLSSFLRERYWLNVGSSEPIGFYRLERFSGELTRGEMVIMRVPPAFEQYVYGRGWLPDGWPLLKHIAGVSGDTYCIGAAVSVNGKELGPVYRMDDEGFPLPFRPGCHQIPEDHFLPIAARIKSSFDGRYMGPVHFSFIEGVARPIFTF